MGILSKYYLLLISCLTISITSYSQHGIIEGNIFDQETRSPITDASINILSGNQGDQTDDFGKFRLENILAGQYELAITHIGYQAIIIPVEVKEKLVSTVTAVLKKSNPDLAEVRVNSQKGNAFTAISQVDIHLRPVNNSQDILRMVPGLFTAQHAGGGKAEQIFFARI